MTVSACCHSYNRLHLLNRCNCAAFSSWQASEAHAHHQLLTCVCPLCHPAGLGVHHRHQPAQGVQDKYKVSTERKVRSRARHTDMHAQVGSCCLSCCCVTEQKCTAAAAALPPLQQPLTHPLKLLVVNSSRFPCSISSDIQRQLSHPSSRNCVGVGVEAGERASGCRVQMVKCIWGGATNTQLLVLAALSLLDAVAPSAPTPPNSHLCCCLDEPAHIARPQLLVECCKLPVIAGHALVCQGWHRRHTLRHARHVCCSALLRCLAVLTLLLCCCRRWASRCGVVWYLWCYQLDHRAVYYTPRCCTHGSEAEVWSVCCAEA